jgi:hypothetical protein
MPNWQQMLPVYELQEQEAPEGRPKGGPEGQGAGNTGIHMGSRPAETPPLNPQNKQKSEDRRTNERDVCLRPGASKEAARLDDKARDH